MTSKRRIGTENSETRAQLLDAAERLMQAEGYSAVTSRRLAKFADLKPQLVHYYFRTMDDLFVALFKKAADEYLEQLIRIKDQNDSLLRMWEISCNRDIAVKTIEFLALANRQESIRDLIVKYSREYNRIQAEIIERAMKKAGIDTERWRPDAIAAIVEYLPRVLGINDAFNLTSSTSAARDLITRILTEQFAPASDISKVA